MDLGKLLSLLQRQALYFRRIDMFEDKFEGYYTEAMYNNLEAYVDDLKMQINETSTVLSDEQLREAVRNIFESSKIMRKQFYANCWHMSYEESHAMWRLYTAQSEAIAICTTFEKLKNMLPERCMVGAVTYIDYKSDIIAVGNTLYPAMHKRKSYEHEKEVRAVFWRVENGEPTPGIISPDEFGCFVDIDANALIEKIYVSPASSAEFRKVVADVVKKYGVEAEVLQSEVNAPPGY